ncbi:DUF1684 domain-containing protein [Streptomyces nojiriensis]|uniref:DUF1684 domain-containing protein n=1 Tax=Streptomyces nojiriensis TaxID=66374 RepID=UPI002E18F8DB
MSDDADDPHAAWREWHERRAAAVSAPCGPLALSGTYWLADYPEGRIPAVPGLRRRTETGMALTAHSRLSAGELVFSFGGAEHTLRVDADADDGSLWAVFGDATAGRSSYRFRFLKPGIPDARGAIAVDSDRSPLPPCAFADHFICPFPPPGNTLPFEVASGERRLKAALATGI